MFVDWKPPDLLYPIITDTLTYFLRVSLQLMLLLLPALLNWILSGLGAEQWSIGALEHWSSWRWWLARARGFGKQMRALPSPCSCPEILFPGLWIQKSGLFAPRARWWGISEVSVEGWLPDAKNWKMPCLFFALFFQIVFVWFTFCCSFFLLWIICTTKLDFHIL